MKKSLTISVLILALFAMCVITSCSNGDLEIINVEETTDGPHWERADITLNVNRVDFDLQGVTRSSDVIWKDGDRIYLILKDKDGNNVQAYVEYDATSASWGQVEYDGYKSYLTCTVPRVVEAYYFDGNVKITSSDITFDATTGVYVCKDGIYTYPSDGDLEVSISLVPLTSRIRFTGESGTSFSLNGMKTYTSFSRSTGLLTDATAEIDLSVQSSGYTPYIYGVFANQEEPSFIVEIDDIYLKTIFETPTNVLNVGHSGYITVPTADSHRGWKQIIPATSISINRNSLVLATIKDIYKLQYTITPVNATSNILWSSSDVSVATVSNDGVVTAVGSGVAFVTAISNDYENVEATCKVIVGNGYAYVDLGLPSGTLWATCNVGADSPEDYGDYFAWGEVNGYDSGKSSFSWSTYKYCNGSVDYMTKYCTNSDYGKVDNKTELELADDAARANWGGSWRMPSREQFRELCNECTWTWTTLNDVNGFKVSSTKNSNYIFLPAAGYRGLGLNDVSSRGYYWSRSLSSTSDCARILRSHLDYVTSSSSNSRCNGYSVRPVLGSE